MPAMRPHRPRIGDNWPARSPDEDRAVWLMRGQHASSSITGPPARPDPLRHLVGGGDRAPPVRLIFAAVYPAEHVAFRSPLLLAGGRVAGGGHHRVGDEAGIGADFVLDLVGGFGVFAQVGLGVLTALADPLTLMGEP